VTISLQRGTPLSSRGGKKGRRREASSSPRAGKKWPPSRRKGGNRFVVQKEDKGKNLLSEESEPRHAYLPPEGKLTGSRSRREKEQYGASKKERCQKARQEEITSSPWKKGGEEKKVAPTSE